MAHKRTNSSIYWINHFAVPPSEGGGTRHFEIGRELVRLGHQVTIVASDFNLHSRQYTRRAHKASKAVVPEQIDDVNFLWLWAAPYLSNDWRRAWNWLSFGHSAAWMRIKSSKPSIVIGSSPHLFAALAGARLASRYRVPFVLEVRDLWPESLLAAGGRKGVVYRAFEQLAKYLYRRADRIVVLARGTGTHLQEMGIDPRKIVYVPNGVDTTASETMQSSSSKDIFTCIYAGAHGPANGLDVVLEAAKLIENRTDIRIVLVGDGPAKESLQQTSANMALKNVEFRASVPKSDMPVLLASANAGLMVLRDSPLFAFGVSPNKLFDYLGARLPVVCNVPGEVAGMLRDSGAGEQAADASPAALAAAILRMVERSQDGRRQLGEAGREWVAREHSRPVLAARLDKMIAELTQR